MDDTHKQLLEELLESTKAWRDDLRDARNDYKSSAKILDSARKSFIDNIDKESKWKRGFRFIYMLVPILFFITVILLSLGSILTGKCSSFGFSDYKFSILCDVSK